MTVRDLSARLGQSGLRLSASSVSEVENAGRKVSVDELLIIAIALNTSIIDLIMPADDDGPLPIASGIPPLSTEELYWWLRGDHPWPEDVSREEFARAAGDLHKAMLLWREDPVVKAVALLDPIVRLARSPEMRAFGTSSFTPGARKALANVNREVGKMIDELEDADRDGR